MNHRLPDQNVLRLIELRRGFRQRLARINQDIREARKTSQMTPELKSKRKELESIVSRLENHLRRELPCTIELVETYQVLYYST